MLRIRWDLSSLCTAQSAKSSSLSILAHTAGSSTCCHQSAPRWDSSRATTRFAIHVATWTANRVVRSEEHTSELQSRSDLVCRLLLEKKKKRKKSEKNE